MRIKEKLNPDKLFFTSDTHFHHTNILEFCNRPWGDIRTHDLALIQNWNKVVPYDGKVFHLGDFAMTSNVDYLRELVLRLNGDIYLIMGNHDYRNRMDRESIKSLFKEVCDIAELNVDGINLVMCHFPMLYWNRGYYHLHGHIHGGPNSKSSEIAPKHIKRYDVGVDNNNYRPISFNELIGDKFLKLGFNE